MRRWVIALAALLLAVPLTGLARPLDAALQQQLLGVYDSYNKAIVAGKLPEALALRSAEVQKQAQQQTKTANSKRELLTMAKTMVPDALEVVHASINAAGDKANIITVAAKTIPKDAKVPRGGPAPGSTVHSGLTLSFVKEGGSWKLDDQMFGIDPSEIVACKDDRDEPEAAYDTDKSVSMGGPIARVDFQADYTLIVIRVVDEENCAFLQANKDELMQHGLDPAKLVPYAIVEIEGSPHKTDKQKILVDSLKVSPED